MTMNNQIQHKDSTKVPEPTLRRLPWYLSNVKLLKQKGERYVSSTQISKEINIDASAGCERFVDMLIFPFVRGWGMKWMR